MRVKVITPTFKSDVYNIIDFGAKDQINFNNKNAIQAAIDECSNNGGGTVLVPNGYFYTGPFVIKSNVNFHLSDNTFIQFSKSKEDYPLIWTNYEGQKRIRTVSPITIENASNVAITGKGVIDGSGDLWRGVKRWKLTTKEWDRCLAKSKYIINTKETEIWYPTETVYNGVLTGEPSYDDPNALEKASEHYDMYRPVLLSIKNSDKVLIEDIIIQNSPAWNIHPWFCTNLKLENVTVKNKFSAQNGDGIDIESCKYVEVSNCVFEVGDDGICVKSGKNAEARQIEGPCEDIWIHDCKVFDAHGGFVIGSEMSRGVRNVLVENCTFIGTDIGVRFKSAIGRGGVVENIHINNIHMANIIEEGFIFTMGYVLKLLENFNQLEIGSSTDMEDIPEFKDIHINNVKCNGSKIAIKVNGLRELPIHDIHFENIEMTAEKALDLSLCKDIYFKDVIIKTKDKEYILKEERMDA